MKEVAPYESGYIGYSDGSMSEHTVVGAALLHERLDALGIANHLHTLTNRGHESQVGEAAAVALFDFIYPYVEN